MHNTVEKLVQIKDEIKILCLKKENEPEIIAVSKTNPIEKINPLIDYGHRHFGENKVQEAILKWKDIKINKPDINLHMIGRLQSNKVKEAVGIFDYIHSLDSYKLAEKISNQQKLLNKNLKYFIQINFDEEIQKSGIEPRMTSKFLYECQNKFSLNIIGLMCLPPINSNPIEYFKKMLKMKNELNLKKLSMGMTSDYKEAIEYQSSFLRIGTKIFGERKYLSN